MTKTYKQVVDIFENISARHKMVGSFINNTPFQVNGNTNLFPVGLAAFSTIIDSAVWKAAGVNLLYTYLLANLSI